MVLLQVVLLSVVLASLLTDFGMTYGSVLFVAQAPDLHISVHKASTTASGGMFLQGPAGLLAVPLVQRYGRLPVLFWSQFITAFMVLGAALSPNYACFTAMRALQGWFNTAPQVVGLSVVHDLFFFHERTKRVNIWVYCLLGGPFLGPFLAAWFILGVSWRADYGILAGFHGFAALLIVLFGDETLYQRNSDEPAYKREKGVVGRIKLLTGITGAKMTGRPEIITVLKDIIKIQFKPQIFFLSKSFPPPQIHHHHLTKELKAVIYIMVLVAWIIGINLTLPQFISAPPYSFSAPASAAAWVSPMIGAFIGGAWGNFFNDWLANRYIRTHNGRWIPETRLWGTYLPTIIGFMGLVLFGEALQHGLHWISIEFAWSFIAFAMVAATTAVSAYTLDCFPNHASIVASIINMWRTTGGFCVVYFQFKWIATSGFAVTFGCQAMTLGVAFCGGVLVTQVFGGRWRQKHLPPNAEN